MKAIIGSLLLIHIISFYILSFVPKLYSVLFVSLIVIFLFLSFKLIHEIKNYKNKKQLILFASSLLLIFILISFIAEIRWSINPFGMIDAYAMWVGKGRVLAISILDGDPLPIWNTYWKMPNYPLGIPLLHANLSLIFPKAEDFLNIITIPNYLYLTLLYFFILEKILELKQIIIQCLFFVITGGFLFQPSYLLITSDLCADFPVSVVLAITTYFLLSSKIKKETFWMVISLALLINLKSEALIIACVVGLFFFSKYFFQKENPIRPLALTFLLLAVFGSPTWYLFGKGSFLSADFNDVNQSKSQLEFLIGRLLDKNIWALVAKYFSNFYFTQTKGLPLLLVFITSLWGSFNIRIGGLFYLVSISIYSGIFLLTSLDLQTHLEQAFDRIHLQLILVPLVVFWQFAKENEVEILDKIKETKIRSLKLFKVL